MYILYPIKLIYATKGQACESYYKMHLRHFTLFISCSILAF